MSYKLYKSNVSPFSLGTAVEHDIDGLVQPQSVYSEDSTINIKSNTILTINANTSSATINISGPYEIGDKIIIKNIGSVNILTLTINVATVKIEDINATQVSFLNNITIPDFNMGISQEFTLAKIGTSEKAFIYTGVALPKSAI